jgi:hypothetical protein
MLLGTATTGVWLASTGLVRLERRFVLALGGTCSFCGKDRAETKMLVGTFGRPTKICDECVGLCCEIIAEETEKENSAPPLERKPINVPPEAEDPLAEILRCLAEEREERNKEMLIADLRRAIDAGKSDIEEFRCSFCDAHRREVAKLIAGPRVHL